MDFIGYGADFRTNRYGFPGLRASIHGATGTDFFGWAC